MDRRFFLKSAGAGLGAVLAACSRPMAFAGPEAYTNAGRSPRILFATGIENSYPRLPDGTRHDQLEQCGHYERWRDDFELARELGVHALRYGPAWYRTNPAPGRYDWSSVDDQMAWLRDSGIAVIADLCHFGVPDWIDGFRDSDLRVHLAAYATAFARRYPWVGHFTPVNEIFVAANFSAMVGWWNDCATGHGSFARALGNLSMAHEHAVKAILAEQPSAIIVQAESFERFAPADATLDALAASAFWNEARFVALDLTLGRAPAPAMREMLLGAGLTTSDLAFLRERRARSQRWIGVDYYITSEQLVSGGDIKRPAPHRLGLAGLSREYYDRYQLPLFISETSRVSTHAVDWLDEQWTESTRLVASGVPVRGFTWFPLGDVIDWRYALRVRHGEIDPIGLYDLRREAHTVASAYADLIASARTNQIARRAGVG